jgi:hypothetical protein
MPGEETTPRAKAIYSDLVLFCAGSFATIDACFHKRSYQKATPE